jgi:alpha-1,2-mannosyltransferase
MMLSRQREIWDPLGAIPAARRWLWAILAVIMCVTQGPEFIGSLRPAPTEGVDFFQEWASARNLRRGLPIYTDLEQSAGLYLGYKRRPGEEMPFVKNAHPPTSVLLALPFAFLNYPNATLTWNLISLVALAVSMWIIGRGLDLKPESWTILPAIALLLICNPLRQQVNQGQINLILLLLLSGVWIADNTGRERWAGVLLGAVTAIKLFPGFIFLYFILRRRWTTVFVGVGTFAAATVLTIAVLGIESYKTYVSEVLPQVSLYKNLWVNASLAGFWTKWFDAGASSATPSLALPRYLPPIATNPVVARAGLIASILAVLVLWARTVLQARSRRDTDMAFGLTLTAMLLISPITWEHYFLFLALPLTQLWIALSPTRRPRVILLLVVICIWINPISIWTALIPEAGGAVVPGTSFRSLTAVSLQCFALIGVFILGLTTRHSHEPTVTRTA